MRARRLGRKEGRRGARRCRRWLLWLGDRCVAVRGNCLTHTTCPPDRCRAPLLLRELCGAARGGVQPPVLEVPPLPLAARWDGRVPLHGGARSQAPRQRQRKAWHPTPTCIAPTPTLMASNQPRKPSSRPHQATRRHVLPRQQRRARVSSVATPSHLARPARAKARWPTSSRPAVARSSRS